MPKTQCDAIRDGLLGDNTLGFLARNVIATDTESETDFPTNSERWLDFEDSGQTSGGGHYYELITEGIPRIINGLLGVSYLPWRRNAGYYVILEPDSGPGIMMTATMSGCSVGYIRSGDGAVRVSHHNISPGLFTPIPEMERMQTRSLQFTTHTFHPSEYHSEDGGTRGEVSFQSRSFGFVFGVRRGRRWTMYAQCVQKRKETDAYTGKLLASDIIIEDVNAF